METPISDGLNESDSHLMLANASQAPEALQGQMSPQSDLWSVRDTQMYQPLTLALAEDISVVWFLEGTGIDAF